MLIHSFLLASTLSLAVSGVSATAAADSAEFFVPGRFIVEYQPELTKRSTLTASNPHEDFHQALAAIHPAGGVRSHFNYSSPLFTGASFSIHDSPDAIARLKSLPNVLNIWPVKRFDVLQTDATDMKQTSHAFGERNWNPHAHTGVAELHSKGLSGQNITIAIIDTGVDYTHPALGGGIGPGHKIVGGYNFVGPLSGTSSNNKTGPSNSQIDQYNPLDCQGHGTHVAGIIAAKDDQNIVGVAPNATIRAYKIFGCSGGTSEDIVIAALQTAFRDGADIITASVGLSGQGLLDGPANLIASRLVEYGVFVSIAAGNSGIEGPRYPSSPGAGEYVTAVGSAESNAILTWNATAHSSSGESITFKYSTARGVLPNISDTTFPVDFLADNADDCTALAAHAANGSALLLPLSSACENAKLYTAAQNNGYKVVLRYTDNPLKYSVPTYSVQGFSIDVFGIAADLGAWARNQTKAGHNLTISLDTLAAQPGVIEADTPRYVTLSVNKHFPPYSHVSLSPTFGKSTFTLNANSTADIAVNFTIPSSLSAAFAPVFQGKIVITGNNGDSLGVPYVGTLLTANTSSATYGTWSTDSDRPRIYGFDASSGSSFEVTDEKTPAQIISSSNVTPQLVFSLADAASYLTFGLVDADFSLESNFSAPLVPNKNGFINHLSGNTFDDGFPAAFIGRTTNDAIIPLKFFANGSDIPSGSYRVVGALLPAPYRPEVNVTANWVTYLSAPFQYTNDGVDNSTSRYAPLNTRSGAVIFTEKTVSSASSGASYLESPYDPVEISIRMRGSNITKGTTAEIGLPSELTGFPDQLNGWSKKFEKIANITIAPPTNSSSGSTVKFLFLKDVETRDLEGALSLYARLKDPKQYASGGAHRVFFGFTDGANGVSYSSLTVGSASSNLTPALKINEPLGGNTDIKVLEVAIPTQEWTRGKVTYILPDDSKFDAGLLESDAQLLQINTPADSAISSNVSFTYKIVESNKLTVDLVVNSGKPSTVRLAVPVPAAQFPAGGFHQFQATVLLEDTTSSSDVVYNLRAVLADALPIREEEVMFRGTDFTFVQDAYAAKSYEHIPAYLREAYYAQFSRRYDRKGAQAQFFGRPYDRKEAQAQFFGRPYDRKEAQAQFFGRPYDRKEAQAQFFGRPYDRKEAQAQFFGRPYDRKEAQAQFFGRPYDRKEAQAQFFGRPYDRKEAQAQFFDRPYELKNAEAQFFGRPYDRKEAQAQFFDRPYELKNAEAQFFGRPYDRKEAQAQFFDRPYELKNAEAQFFGRPYDRKEAQAQFFGRPYDRKEAQAQFFDRPYELKNAEAQFFGRPYDRKEAQAEFFGRPYDRKEAQAQFFDRPYELKNAEAQFFGRPYDRKEAQAQFFGRPYDRKEAQAQFFDRPYELKNAEAQFFGRPYDRKQAEAQFWGKPYDRKEAQAQFFDRPYELKNAEAQFGGRPYDRKEAEAQFFDRPFELKGKAENVEAQFGLRYDRKAAEAQFGGRPYDRKEAEAQSLNKPSESKGKAENVEAEFGRRYHRRDTEPQFFDRPFELKGQTENVDRKEGKTQFFDRPFELKDAEAQFFDRPFELKGAEAQFFDRPFELKGAEAQFFDRPFELKGAEAQFFDRPFELKGAEAQFWGKPYDRKEAQAQFFDRPFELKGAEAQFFDRPFELKGAEAQFFDRPFELKGAEAQFFDRPFELKGAEAQFFDRPFELKGAEAQFFDRPFELKGAEAQFFDRPFELKGAEAQFFDRPFELKGAEAQFFDRPFELKGAEAQFFDRPFELKGAEAQFWGKPYDRKEAQAQFFDRPFELKGAEAQFFDRPFELKGAEAQFFDRPFELKGAEAQFFDRPFELKGAEAQFFDRPFELKGAEAQFFDRPFELKGAEAQFFDRPFELKGAETQFFDRPFELKGKAENVDRKEGKAQFFDRPFELKGAEAQFFDRPFELKGNAENVEAQFGRGPYDRKDAQAQFFDRPFELKDSDKAKANAQNMEAQFGRPYDRKDADKFGTAGAPYYYYKNADNVRKEEYLKNDAEAIGFGVEWF
ncbi:hypothetical protein DV451_002428 [Geotrichum candidum]|uniref:Peptidase S8/S53 domain-containing protein n=1 Tax=Geotrichum candidum TaxID=1173061 RepID=A0A9P5G692_GEOCN|nr:hypothetical protein DV451_002428 [Geotrichum candidum]KAF5110667.1 hypothetical protein DV453_000724 [Geotrichum candidum]